MKPTEESVEEWLDSLGTTADEVANSCRALGYKGRPQQARVCPISNGAKQHFGVPFASAYKSVFVGELGGNYTRVNLTRPVDEFIQKFDDGEYPDLVEAR